MAVCRVNKSRDYTVMSNRHLRDKNLSLKAKGLLSIVLSLPEDWDYSVSGLCAVCGEGETAVKSALKELKSNGYLTVTKVYPGDSNSGRIEYVYDFFENNDGRVQQNQEVKKQGLENLGLEILGVESDLLPNSNNNIINTEEPNTEYKYPLNPPMGEDGQPQAAANTKPPKRKKATAKEDYDLEGFNAFYAAYPRHEGKADALKAWNKLKPDIVLQTKMGEALTAQKKSPQWTKNNGQYIPMPSTWLNGKRWEDETAQPQNQESQYDRMMAWAKEFDETHGSI